MPKLSTSSAARLLTCHPLLQRLFSEVVQHVDCTVLCGMRSKADQDEAFAEGTSRLPWPNSKHNQVPSLAVDIMPYPVDWHDLAGILAFAAVVKETAARLGIEVEWGGDFKTFKDRDHWQLKTGG